ncbi:hypothetical protein [Soonwooa sp.]|uniref:hypothetical protein n=1 Tax=Soonwooa sp. TaxID=1938592 RepID=UPI002612B423|nr:hypothetical protein [Soonwooa sp.]
MSGIKNFPVAGQMLIIWIIPMIVIWGIVLFILPISNLVYAAVIAVLLTIFVFGGYLKFNWTDWWRYTLVLGFSYMIVIGILSFSPRLKIYDYRLWNPSMQASQVTVDSLATGIVGGKSAHPYVAVNYSYSVNSKSYYKKNERVEERDGFMFDFKSQEQRQLSLENWGKKQIKKGDYEVFYSKNNPQESKFFIDTSWISYVNSSMFYWLLTVVIVMFLSIVIRLFFARLGIKS